MTESEGARYCTAEVRRHDPDRYLSALFAPQARRRGLFALYAFNLELARIRELVNECQLGEIRLAWWREALANIGKGAPPNHLVATELGAAIARHGLDRALLAGLIDARAADLEDAPPADLAALERYAEETAATLVRLALGILGVDDRAAHRAARHVGIGWALTGILRAVPFQARARRLFLPADLCARAGLAPRAVYEGRPGPALGIVAAEVASLARDHLAAARTFRGDVPAAARPALLSATLADGYLARLARAGHDPFDARLERGRLARQLRLAIVAARGRY